MSQSTTSQEIEDENEFVEQQVNEKDSKKSTVKLPKFQTLRDLAKSVDDFSVIPYYITYLVPLTCFFGVLFNGGFWYFTTPILAFVIVPTLDLLLPSLKLNPTPEQEKILEKQFKFQLPVWMWVPTQILSVFFAGHILCTWDLTLMEQIGLIFSMGILESLSVNVAHELGHKLTRIEKLLAKTSLAFICYMHFQIEHPLGHHWNVATPLDPATSRLGESFYEFYPRTVINSFTSAWSIESKRLEKENKPKWGTDNQMLWFIFWPMVITTIFFLSYGMLGAFYFLLQGFIGFSFLEIINYIEHYGLLREEISPGRYEPVRPIHSWNANESVSNYFLFKLQRHSDHHTFPVRRYQLLRSFDESPQLPTGYAGCILLAVFPPLWRYVMDPRVLEARKMIQRYKAKSG